MGFVFGKSKRKKRHSSSLSTFIYQGTDRFTGLQTNMDCDSIRQSHCPPSGDDLMLFDTLPYSRHPHCFPYKNHLHLYLLCCQASPRGKNLSFFLRWEPKIAMKTATLVAPTLQKGKGCSPMQMYAILSNSKGSI